ncbi:hypothetical protein GIY23_11020 [Allosaccharopolyspora coralli]|uniref:Glycosyl transferase n=1 Tax=Allosaccharopolyspora coralli TaxID=2665642 RepID=A0A5Q3Q684_9PSEU|nr:macrolide family glycosyltransferase [Allosaccharopolyspora coralli]QGK69982.1 hypothetical protein GIY23_11020 [Allosaccharopolyspora coralli]
MHRHFAFVAPPAHGHVNPTLPLVEELTRRGHRVSYATGAALIPTVEAAGATGVTLPMEPPPGRSAAGQISAEHFAEMMRKQLTDARTSLPTLLTQFTADLPDAVCADMLALAGRMLAESLDVPDVALLPSFAANERFSLHEQLLPTSFDFQHPALTEILGEMRRFTASYGLNQTQQMFPPPPASLNLVFIPERFQIAAETFDHRFRFLGPAFGSRRRSESWQPAEAESPLLYISLGTLFNDRPEFYRMCFEAFADSPWQVAISVGQSVAPSDLGEIPTNVEVRQYFPQLAVLERASVFLSHAGMNSTMESLYHGVPLVTVPQMPEQEANARRVEELGLGRRVPDDVDAGVLRKFVDDVGADEHIRSSVAAMRDTVRAQGGAVAGADALETSLA